MDNRYNFLLGMDRQERAFQMGKCDWLKLVEKKNRYQIKYFNFVKLATISLVSVNANCQIIINFDTRASSKKRETHNT